MEAYTGHLLYLTGAASCRETGHQGEAQGPTSGEEVPQLGHSGLAPGAPLPPLCPPIDPGVPPRAKLQGSLPSLVGPRGPDCPGPEGQQAQGSWPTLTRETQD